VEIVGIGSLSERRAIIIGGGPAGLTAALELIRRTDIKPIVYESADDVGGIARTHEHKGNRIDIGGHRFFSKSDRVMSWWDEVLPLQGPYDVEGLGEARKIEISYQNKKRWLDIPEDGPNPDEVDDIMLVRARTSRILFRGKMFDYPISLSVGTLLKLGPVATMRIGCSYIYANMFPVKPETSLRDFFVNRFGQELYGTFFKDYTEKVWGVPCEEISAEWGAQRIKGLSLLSAIAHAIKSIFKSPKSLAQKDTETSLIEQFLYPKFGPGHMWRKVVEMIEEGGGEVVMNTKVTKLRHENGRITGATIVDPDGKEEQVIGDYFFSTTDMTALFAGLEPAAPADIRAVSDNLIYRDFITVGILADKIMLGGGATGADIAQKVPDNWIYIQEPHVKLGRLQIFNNWSPYLVADQSKVWMGLEYFCDEGDELWTMDDDAFAAFAKKELEDINIARTSDVVDHVVIRVPKTYPAYFGAYDDFDRIRNYIDGFENLYLIGRNGMHRYNNQDHSMLTAMVAVDNIAAGITDKENVWSVNTETEYHEEK